MIKKKSWFARIKRLFVSDSKPKQGKSGSKRRWILRIFKTKRPYALPPPPPMKTMPLIRSQEEQSKHLLAVAAAEVAGLTGNLSCYRDKYTVAAIKIQAVFRGHLARQALRALRGLVKLQALIRGQVVRRNANATLKGLQSMMKIQSQTCASRYRTSTEHLATEYRDVIYANSEELPDKRTNNSEREWNNSILSKEDINTVLENRLEGAFKRSRVLQYESSRQRKNSPRTKAQTGKLRLQADDLNQRWSWLEQWVDSQMMEDDPPEKIIPPSPDDNPHYHRGSDNLLSVDFQDIEKAEEVQLRYLARRSFLKSQTASRMDDNSLSSSSSQPGYMASTASAKAKFRSISTPRQRRRELENCCAQSTPYPNTEFSPAQSIVSDAKLSKSMKHLSLDRRSPEVKCQTPVRSQRSSNHLSFDSDLCFLNWDQPRSFR